jgi:polysaccharide biosynthesis protein PslG
VVRSSKQQKEDMGKSFGRTIVWATIIVITACSLHGQTTAPPMSTNPIQATDFGFACNFDHPTACQAATWITTVSQPGTLRLHDTGTTWQRLTTGPGQYRWMNLDLWLDSIAAHQPRAVLFTFNRVPCWNVRESRSACASRGSPGSPDPPADLSASGSPSFNSFVDAVTKHCSPAGHCVKDYIKYFEMWNEPNTPRYWNGTAEQLYDMVKAAAAVIRANVPGVLISTPAPFPAVNPGWMDEWLALENTKGRISDIYGFHLYIGPGSKWITDNDAPEERFLDFIVPMLDKKNKAGWTSTPWMNTETGFLGSGPYNCPLDKDATDAICDAFLARWFILQFSYGAEHIDWYWFTAIGQQDETYNQVMHWLVGSRFTGTCTHAGPIVECPLTQANNHSGLIVWNASSACSGKTCGTTTSYNVKSQFRTVKDLSGNASTVPENRVVAIGAMPILLTD